MKIRLLNFYYSANLGNQEQGRVGKLITKEILLFYPVSEEFLLMFRLVILHLVGKQIILNPVLAVRPILKNHINIPMFHYKHLPVLEMLQELYQVKLKEKKDM